jgi:hypothetical protein
MTENQAVEQIGAGVFQAITECWMKAWDEIRGPLNNPDYCNRIRSSLLQEHASINGRQILPSLGFTYSQDETQHMFVLPDVACIVFKKLDEDLRAHRNDTIRSQKLFQSSLFKETPTLIAGMAPTWNWLDHLGVFLCRPNNNGIGNAWVLNITDHVVSIDEDQTKIVPVINESEPEFIAKPKQKYKPKYAPNIAQPAAAASGGTDQS